MRICNKCCVEKEDKDFYNRRSEVTKTCKRCEIESSTAWKKLNKDKVAINDKIYKDKNKVHIIEVNKIYKKATRGRLLDPYIRQLIYKNSQYMVNKETLDANPESFEFIKSIYISRKQRELK